MVPKGIGVVLQVITTVMTSGSNFRNKKNSNLPSQVEQILAEIAVEEANRLNEFAVSYMNSMEQGGQVPQQQDIIASPQSSLHCLHSWKTSPTL